MAVAVAVFPDSLPVSEGNGDRLRLHAVRTANNDGSQAATITPEEIPILVEQANVVFCSAGIEFRFDPVRDFERRNDTLLNNHFTLWVDPADYTGPDGSP